MTKHLKFDRHGNPIEDDVLPDGATLRTLMMLMDGSTVEFEDWQPDATVTASTSGIENRHTRPRSCDRRPPSPA